MLQNNALRTRGEAGHLQRYTFRSTTVQAVVRIAAPVYPESGLMRPLGVLAIFACINAPEPTQRILIARLSNVSVYGEYRNSGR
jgi:hypothetical protein